MRWQIPSSALLQLLLTGALVGPPLVAAPAQAHMRGLKFKGAFAMGAMWMPCSNERALHDALQKAQ